MKVLTLNHSDTNGGAARAAFRIFNALRKIEVDNKMLVKLKHSFNDSVIEYSAYNNRGAVKLLGDISWKIKNSIRKSHWNIYTIQEGAYLSDLFAVNLNKALNSIDFDILHLHWINEQFLDIRELKKISNPIIWTLHDSWPFTGICHYFYDCENYKSNCGKCPFLNSKKERDISKKVWKAKFEVYKDCNIQVVCPSNWLADAARKSSLFKNFNVKVIPNCLNTSTYRPVNKEMIREILGLVPDKKYILFSAINSTSDKNKGYHYIKKATEELSKKRKSDIELLIVGSTDIKKSELFGFPANFLGHLYDEYSLSAFYNAADITVVPSLSENLSNVIMESLSCGTPVAAFNVGGNSDMVDHLKNGYLAKPYITLDLADGINWCIENNKNNSLSKQARKKVLENFTIEKVGLEYLNLYKSLLKRL